MLKKYAQTLSTFKVISSEFDVCSTLSETPFVCAVKSIHNLTDLCVTTCMSIICRKGHGLSLEYQRSLGGFRFPLLLFINDIFSAKWVCLSDGWQSLVCTKN